MYLCVSIINLSTERFNWRPMLLKMLESGLPQLLQVAFNYELRFNLLIGLKDVERYDDTVRTLTIK